MYAFEKDIIEFVESLHGREGIEVIKYLMKNGSSTDAEIAKKVKLRENIIRKILYDLHELNCVDLTKKKIGEGRMYEFRWSINYRGFHKTILNHYNEKKEEIQRGIDFLKGVELYSCGNPKHPALTIEEAFEYDFKCPLCMKILYPVDNTQRIEELEREKEEINAKISKIERHYKAFVKKKLSKK